MSDGALYDRIAGIYDPWSVSVTEDVELYVEEALASGGPVVELAVGTGRIAVPTAKAGIDVIGVDQSSGMLSVARSYGEREGVAERLDIRVGRR
jgi:ubiquinone/menaquinone biosynthesis C-methylase UbiE